MVQGDQGIRRDIVEHRLHPLIEQGRPVLGAAAALAFADPGVERIVARRPELGHIAGAEARDAGGVQQHLADRQQVHRGELAGRPLGLRIEGADRFQGVAEQVQPDRLVRPGREHIDHPAADGELPALRHGGRPHIAIDREVAFQVGDIHALAGLGVIGGLLQSLARGNPLDERRHGGDQQARRSARRRPGQGAERRHPLGGDGRRGADPVIGQAVPVGQAHHRDLAGEEGQRVDEGRSPGGVAGDEHRQTASRLEHVGHGQGVEPLRRAGEVQTAGRGRDPLQLGNLLGQRDTPKRRGLGARRALAVESR